MATTEEQRKHVLLQLEWIWRQFPDLRLGQLLVGASGNAANGNDIFYVEDQAMLLDLAAYVEKNLIYKDKG